MNQLAQKIANQTIRNSTANNQPKAKRGDGPLGNASEIHQLMMIVIWLVAATIGLWSMAFKQYRWAMYIHFFCMGIVTILNWMGGFLALIVYGVDSRIGPIHTWLGIAILIGSALQCISGMICWFFQKGSKIKPLYIIVSNYIHTLFGWAIFIAVLVEILLFTKKKLSYFLPVIIISLVSYVPYLLFKLFRKRMQLKNDKYKDKTQIPLVYSSQDLNHLNNDYFIFQDKVYDIHNVLGYHPGGYELIKRIKGRQIDRFMYGAQTIENINTINPYLHMSNSLAMAGKPVGIVASNNPYKNLFQCSNALVYQVIKPTTSNQIYAPYLIAQNSMTPFIYEGYSDVSQLGKYFTVTINSALRNKTRLYSIVNFMHPTNIELMNKVLGKNYPNVNIYTNQSSVASQRSLERIQYVNSVPLLIKKYKNGQFTSKFLEGVFARDVRISNPYGFGLSLQQIPHGQLIFFAGGTGIYPFCDTIDLLFKQVLVQNRSSYVNQILKLNPILHNNPILGKYKISLYYSIRSSDELIDIVGQQLNYLNNTNQINAIIKVSMNSETIKYNYPGINITQKKFQQFVPQILARLDKISQIYLCGPPTMTGNLSDVLTNNKVPRNKFRIL